MKALAVSAFVGAAVLFTPTVPMAAYVAVRDELVNVAVGNVTIVEDVNNGVAAQVAANIFGVDVGPVAMLGQAVDRSGGRRAVCTADQGPVTIRQN